MICQELSQVLETLYSGKYELAIRNLKAQKQKKKKDRENNRCTDGF